MTSSAPSVAYAGLFPADVVVVETLEPGDPSSLLPAEAAAVSRAVGKRVREFAAGRHCARQALARFDIHGFAVVAAADRQPQWPASLVGSITHTDGFCAAAVASRDRWSGIGIDTEVVAPVSPRLAHRICVPDETAWIGSLAAEQREAAIMLVFSAKEAFFKCQYPLVGEWLEFRDLCVRTEAAPTGRMRLQIDATRPIAAAHHVALPASGRGHFHGRYVSTGFAFERREVRG